jgi:hypothetical protein
MRAGAASLRVERSVPQATGGRRRQRSGERSLPAERVIQTLAAIVPSVRGSALASTSSIFPN